MPAGREHSIIYTRVNLDHKGGVSDFEAVQEDIKPLFDSDIAKLPSSLPEQVVRNMLSYHTRQAMDLIGSVESLEANTNTLHFLEILLDYERREFETGYYQRQYDDAREKYEYDKRTLKGKKYYERIKSWADSENISYKSKVKGAEELRKTTIDIFIKDFFLTEDGLDQLSVAIEDTQDLPGFDFARIQKLFEEATARVKDKAQLTDSSLNYSDNKEEILNSETAKVLRKLAEAALSQQRGAISENAIRELSKSLVDMFWARAEKSSTVKNIECSKFVYDILFAVTSSRDVELTISGIQWINTRTSGYSKYQKELRYLDKEIDRKPLEDEDKERLTKVSHLPLPELADLDEDKIQKEFIKLIRASKPSQALFIAEGIRASDNLYFYLTGKHTNLINGVRNMYERNAFVFAVIKMFAAPAFYYEDSLWANVSIYLPNEDREKMLMKPEFIVEAAELEQGNNEDQIAEAKLLKLFSDSSSDSSIELIKKSEEIKKQHRRIRDDYQYFVALNGDRFTSDEDNELASRGIRSVTFFPIRQRPLNHIVDIKLADRSQNSIRLHITGDGKFLHRYGTASKLPLSVTNQISEAVLPRLEFITSGAAFTKQETTIGPVGIEPSPLRDLLARRAHWRRLPGNRYSLLSAGAQMHIQQVLEDYGINTWEEILRRRTKGTLKENEVLTYVRAVIKAGADPNDLVFDPKKLKEKQG